MSLFKIATWNVNSLRVRLNHLMDWVQTTNPDVIALQETKVVDDDFPVDAVKSTGYFPVFSGQKSYNGMAIFTRLPVRDVVKDIEEITNTERRILALTVGDVRILNLYVPNGNTITSDKYQFKLNWLSSIQKFLQNELVKYPKLIILGDFNIAPDAMDVHDPQKWAGQVLYSEPERNAFQNILNVGFNDCFRSVNKEIKDFSWWDYRLNAFKRNLGLRIDHILASHALISNCCKCHIDKTPRSWDRPSDHAPVIAEFQSILKGD